MQTDERVIALSGTEKRRVEHTVALFVANSRTRWSGSLPDLAGSTFAINALIYATRSFRRSEPNGSR